MVALAIGLLIGAERERSKGTGPQRNPGGLRTFAVAALLGAVGYLLGTPMLVVFAAAIGLLAAIGYALSPREDPGMTTELALVLTFGLGALAQTSPMLAIGAGVVTATLLAFRARLHGIVTELLTTREMLDALIFAVCALVILPQLPDRAIGPLGVLNPFVLWRLVVLMMGITGLGYIAQRFVGARFGLAVSGFASGFVSSTATVYAMGRRAREQPDLGPASAAGAAASSVATFVQVAILVGDASPSLVVCLAPALAAGGAVASAYAALLIWRAARAPANPPKRDRAFHLRTAITFAVFVTAVLLLTRLVQSKLGTAGALVASALAGFADAHATSASVASLHAGGLVDDWRAIVLVLVSVSTNTVTKAVAAFMSGPRAFGIRVVAGLALMLVVTWAVAL